MSEQKEFRAMLTTIDNPFNPFHQFKEWNAYDIANGYYTNQLLSSVANSIDSIDDDSVIDAMRQIVMYNLSGKHIMVTEETFDALIKIE